MLGLPHFRRNVRSARRYREVLGILVGFGFGHLVEELNVNQYLELGRRLLSPGRVRKDVERLATSQRLRLAFEALGPTFVKLGQLLSTRHDLLPDDYVRELAKLQDEAPFVPFAAIAAEIEAELGASIPELFSSVDEIPLAAASIAQVHRAVLKDGTEVVLKVRRPGIRKLIETDLDILSGIAQLIAKHLPSLAHYDPVGIAREFRQTLFNEMDFTREGQNVERFAAHFKNDETVKIPEVFWDFTSSRILTLEYIDGIKVSEIARLKQEGYDTRTIARNGASAFIRQVMMFGLFHGDPHPGNIFILPGNRICFLDYGMVGHLGEEQKYRLLDVLEAIMDKNPDPIVSHLLYSGELPDDTDLRALKRDLSHFIDKYYEVPLQQIRVGDVIYEFLELHNHYRIRFPADLSLLAKTLVTMEGLGRRLDPEFDMVEQMRPFVHELLRQRVSPLRVSKDSLRMLRDYISLMRGLPRDLKEFINRLNRNRFKIQLEHRGLEKLISEFDKSSNRISFSLVISALIIGSSLIMLTEKGPRLFGFPMMGLLGYSIAGLLGLWLAIGILRSGRL